MNLSNKTGTTIFWSVTSPGQADCGTLGPHQQYYFPAKSGPTYSVSFTAQDPTYFTVNAQASQSVTLNMSVSGAALAEADGDEAAANS